MTVASRAVAMAVMTEARALDVEQEGHTSHWEEMVAQSGTTGIIIMHNYKQHFEVCPLPIPLPPNYIPAGLRHLS